jgi:predicted nucleic acid-binding protein
VRSVLVDSGPFIALFDASDDHHERAVEVIRAFRGRLVTNAAVLTEVCHLLGFHQGAPRLDFLAWVERAVEVDGPTPDDLPRARAILERYATLPADFTDATLVRLAERRKITEIFTVDRDLDVYRTLSRRVLRNRFFADAP